jgi:hypothetical protein
VEELLVKKVEVTALIQCRGVWFACGKFGVSWKAVQIRLDSAPAGLRGCAFEDDGEEEGGAEFSAVPRGRAALVDDEEEDEAEAPVPAAPTKKVVVADSDDEVAPAPLPKKTVVTKKKVVAGAVAK